MWFMNAAVVQDQFPQAQELLDALPMSRWSVGGLKLLLKATRGSEERWAIGSASGPINSPSIDGITWIGINKPWEGPSIFIGSAGRVPDEDVKAFSELEEANRQEEVLPSLRIIEPRLQRLSLLLSGGKPMIHGDIGLSRLVPMSFMGEGIRRLLSVLLAVATARDGIVLIDEVENGFHYSVLTKVWQAIAHAARQANVQVFATTHSWECILRAHEAFAEEDAYDLRLHRLDRSGDQISAVSYDREMIEAALYNAVEMR
jgi:hypothetical protein